MEIFISDRIGISKHEITDEGFLIVRNARIARTGIQEYRAFEFGTLFSDRDPLDIIRVYRPEEEVFNDEAMKSFENKPITNNHPDEGIVNSENFKSLAVGFTLNNVQQDGIFLTVDLTVTDLAAIKDVEAGKRELSNGYKSAIIIEDGITPDGKQYDAIQRTIRGNHVAIVDAARCGPQCSISDKQLEEKPMRVLLQGIPFEIEDAALAAAVQKVSDENTELVKKQTESLATNDSAMAALREENDAKMQKLQAELDQAKSNEMTPDKLDSIIDERMEIIDAAKKVVEDYDPKGKTCMQIKREILEHKFGDSIKEKMENDIYVSARFDALMEAIDSEPKTKLTPTEQALIDAANNGNGDNQNMTDSDIARVKKMIGNKIAWKFPPGAARKKDPDFIKAVDTEFNLKYGTK